MLQRDGGRGLGDIAWSAGTLGNFASNKRSTDFATASSLDIELPTSALDEDLISLLATNPRH
jgi:hypothetical protein